MTPDEHAETALSHLQLAEEAFANGAPEVANYRLRAAQIHATLSLRPTGTGFVPRHETLSAEDFAAPAENPNPDGDYFPGS